MSAVASPQSLTTLSDAVEAARLLARSVNYVAEENVRLRTEADREIARQVGQVNDTLHRIADANAKITTLRTQGEDVSGLQDERDRLIDSISSIIPLRAVRREGDQIAIYSANGAALLDGRVWELGFTPGPSVVTADMTVGAPLSALTQDQGGAAPATLATGTGSGPIDGGSLGALFEIRDTIVPGFDAEMDRYAEELIARFRDLMPAGALDGAGEGLFVENAAAASSSLAGRLSINAAVDPTQGGEAWRLRAGLSAATPGDEGFGDYLQGLADAMAANRAPAGWITQNASSSAAIMASEIASFFAGRSARSDDAQAFLTARQTALADSEANAIGVDTDRELQSLILVEQAYAANARVLSVIDGLLNLLLER
jgi:flagellar hook-associated protein 1 FlgK